MKKKQHVPSTTRMIMKPRIGSAITMPRFTPPEEAAPGVERDMEEGRRTSVKIREGEISNW